MFNDRSERKDSGVDMVRRWEIVGAVLASVLLFGSQAANGAAGQGTLFGTDARGFNLLTVAPGTGIGTVVGPLGFPVPALAAHPTTGVLYAGEGRAFPRLYTVNPATGAPTLVGGTMLGVASIGSLDFDRNGVLYAAVNIAGDGGTGSDHLATIDTTTGLATVIGPFGTCTGVVIPSVGGGSCTIEGMEGIAFAPGVGLWGVVSANSPAGAPGLYGINPATGAATFHAPILDGMGVPATGGLVSLQFGCDGTLYGGTARALPGGPADGGFLVTVNSASGLLSFVGATSATTGGTSLGALAFAQPCPADIPTLNGWSSVLLALLILIAAVAVIRRLG